MVNRRWFVLLCVLFNSGCFQPYIKPRVNIPHEWPNQHHLKLKEPAFLADLLWWKQFKSPELDELIEHALYSNGQIQIALSKIEQAQAQLDQIKLSWFPNAAWLAGYSQFPYLGNPGSIAMVYPSYIINIFQMYKKQKGARALYEASIYANDCARLVVIAQTTTSFFTLLAQNEALHLYNKLMADYGTYLKILNSQYRSGLTSLDNIEKVRSAMRQAQSQMELARYNVVISKNALRFLLNENPGGFEIKASFNHINSDALIPGNRPVSVLSARPDIRRAEALLRAAHFDAGAVTAELLPTINLGAYLGTTSDGALKLGQAYGTGPIVDLPILAKISERNARYKEMLARYVTTIRAALRDVANDLVAFSTFTKQFENNSSALLDEQRYCRLAKIRTQHGLESDVELIKCKIEVDRLELMVNQNKLQKMMALVTLYQDLAGGYHGD